MNHVAKGLVKCVALNYNLKRTFKKCHCSKKCIQKIGLVKIIRVMSNGQNIISDHLGNCDNSFRPNFSSKQFIHFLDHFIPFGRMLEPNPAPYGWRQGTPLDESPGHHKVLRPKLRVRYLAQGYLCTSAVLWRCTGTFTLLPDTPSVFCLHWGWKWECSRWSNYSVIKLY